MEEGGDRVADAATKLCTEDYLIELKERGILLPSRKISPVFPHLRMEEYDMMERDRGKCIALLLYH